MELWTAYHRDGTPAGLDLVRGEPIPPGLYHLVCDILVRHIDGDYLLMQRSWDKPNFGGCWEATAGGSALRGESSLCCARRELQEETGITSGELTLLGISHSHNTIYHSYLFVTAQDKSAVTLQPGETIAFRWLSRTEFARFVQSRQMIPTQQQRLLPYLSEEGFLPIP